MSKKCHNLEDLVIKVAKELSLHSHVVEEGMQQFKFLTECSKKLTAKQMSKSVVLRRDLDRFPELETIVHKAETYDIHGSKKAREEFEHLIINYRIAGCPPYQRKQNLLATLQPLNIPARPRSMLENKHDTIKRMSSLPRRKQEQGKPTTNDRPRTPKDPNAIQISKEEYSRLKASEEKLAAEVEDLKSRLSKFASDKMSDDNPNIADLSDRNRPTKIGERFGELYDNEWSEAYEELKGMGKEENEIIAMLHRIVELAKWFCSEVAEQQLPRLELYMKIPLHDIRWTVPEIGTPYVVDQAAEEPTAYASVPRLSKELRKSAAVASIPALCVMFKDAVYRAEFNIEYNKHPTLEKYIDECISCVWLMSVQDPPMDLRWQKADDQIELDSFRFYDRKGKTVELAVWPAVCLYHGGPLVSKGYVLPKDAEQ